MCGNSWFEHSKKKEFKQIRATHLRRLKRDSGPPPNALLWAITFRAFGAEGKADMNKIKGGTNLAKIGSLQGAYH